MIYTYEISFNGSDYLSFTPNNFPLITTDKMESEFIWTNSADEFKITEELNASVYGTLETWFGDQTKYSLTNRIRIKKSGSVKWNFNFGIKMGEINYENKYYTVTPEIDEPVSDVLYYKDRVAANALNKSYHYVDEDDATPEEIYGATMYRYEDWMTSIVNRLNTFSSNTYTTESAFLWNDDYPDGSSPGADNYVSSDYNYLNDWAISRDNSEFSSMGNLEISHILQIPKMLQCYWFVASDFTIHLEHVRWFRDQIADSQLDLTGLDYYDDARVFRYSTPEIYAAENFAFPTDNEAEDFDDVQILYEPELVNFRSESVDVITDYDAFLSSDFANLAKYGVVGTTDLGVGWRSNTFDTWTQGTGLNITAGIAAASGRLALSNFLAPVTAQTINYSLDLNYNGVPSNEIEITGYNGGVAGPSGWTTLNEGVNAGTKTGDTIAIRSTGAEGTFDFTLSVTITNRYRIPWETGEISTDSLPNNYLSWANNLNRFWRDDRYALEGEMNESDETFLTSKMVKEQDTFKFYYADDIDPMRGITTDYGVGMIQSMERDLASDWITLKLRYE